MRPPYISKQWITLFARFGAVSSVGFVCNFCFLQLFTYLGQSAFVAEVLATIIALQVTFLLHDTWTYTLEAKPRHLKPSQRYISYLASNAIGSCITIGLFTVFVLFLPQLFALASATFVAMFWNFSMNKLVIWRSKAPERQ